MRRISDIKFAEAYLILMKVFCDTVTETLLLSEEMQEALLESFFSEAAR